MAGEEEIPTKGPDKVIANFEKEFQWPKITEASDDYGEHPDIDDELEQTENLPQARLPYHTTELFRGNEDTMDSLVHTEG